MPEDSKDVKIGTTIALMVNEGEDWKDVTIPASAAEEAPSDPPPTPVSQATPSVSQATPTPSGVPRWE